MEKKELTKENFENWTLCNVGQHVGLSEGGRSLSPRRSLGNVFSEEIFLWIYVFLFSLRLKANFSKITF